MTVGFDMSVQPIILLEMVVAMPTSPLHTCILSVGYNLWAYRPLSQKAQSHLF